MINKKRINKWGGWNGGTLIGQPILRPNEALKWSIFLIFKF